MKPGQCGYRYRCPALVERPQLPLMRSWPARRHRPRPGHQCQQIDEEEVAPGSQLGDAASGSFDGNDHGETLLQLGSQRWLAQGLPPVRHRCSELVEEVIDPADPAGKVKGQMWPHQGPAKPRPRADRYIDVANACHPLGYQMQRLAPQRRRQPVGDMSRHLAADVDRLLADCGVEGERPFDRLGTDLLAANDLDQRHQMRGIERVADDAAFRVPAIDLHPAHQQSGRTRRDDDFRIEDAVEPGQQGALQLLAFGSAFLDELGANHGRFRMSVEAQRRPGRLGR